MSEAAHGTPQVLARELTVHGRAARVYVGGAGPALLLVHGGWGGAPMHWRRVWTRLAKNFQVVAPDLPGIGALDQPALGTYAGYARFLDGVLGALDVSEAWVVGNSFGGSVAWRFAGDFPEKCLGLVMVNGIPVPRTPRALLLGGRTRFGRAVMRAMLKRFSYTPDALPKAFVNPLEAPSELEAVLRDPNPPQLASFVGALIEGDGGPAPRARTLFLWGGSDRLLGTGPEVARKLHDATPDSELQLLEGAGHFPQAEQPDAFIEALERFARRR